MTNTVTLKDWLSAATKQLKDAGIASARLDAEVILAHTVRHNRAWLHAHDDELLDNRRHDIADARLGLRLERTPIAYIIGHKEFYGRNFRVTPATLVPRPESEIIIELLADLPLTAGMHLVDVGTGTGCLGITAKLEHPELEVSLLDIEQQALTVAEQNAVQFKAAVTTLKSDLLGSYPFTANIILANLPYLDDSWSRDPETNHEPRAALFAADNGLELIKRLINESRHRLAPGGYVLIEAEPKQHHLIAAYAESHGLNLQREQGFCQAYRS